MLALSAFAASAARLLIASGRRVWSSNGYSPSGNATGRLVYANFGLPEDFATYGKMAARVAEGV